MKHTWLCGFLFLGCASQKIYNPPLTMIVVAPVADVRAKPIPSNKKYENDPLQETQIEKGEMVLVHKAEGAWVYIEVPDQQEFTHNNKWEGYPGWVLKKELKADTTTQHALQKLAVSNDALRQHILESALLHLNTPYYWGGRSLYNLKNKSVATGVDCSGLVNWSYRQVGWIIPRDAQEQYLKAKKIEVQDMKPADLIFLAAVDKPEKVVHVALYAGEDNLIEAPQTGDRVRKISAQSRFGKPLLDIKNGEKINDRIIFFGSFFEENNLKENP